MFCLALKIVTVLLLLETELAAVDEKRESFHVPDKDMGYPGEIMKTEAGLRNAKESSKWQEQNDPRFEVQVNNIGVPKRGLNVFEKRTKELLTVRNYPRDRRAAINNRNMLWEYGVIPFTVDTMFSFNSTSLFELSMRLWETDTCIVFKEREPHDKHYIVFTQEECGCCSDVGRKGGAQNISIGQGCDVIGIIAHELGHVIGFYHEHARPDRGNYVNILYENIQQGEEYNFNTIDDIDSLEEPYDYYSIMHYPKTLFRKEPHLNTLEFRSKLGEVILNNVRPSKGDIQQVNKLYKCPTCGRSFHESTESISHVPVRGKPNLCQWRILSAHGQKVVLNITGLDLLHSINCKTDYLEIRDGHYAKSRLIRRICGRQILGPIRSSGNRMWIEFKTSHGHGKGFNATYVTECGGRITKDEGLLVSPNYPGNYPHSKECVWIITVPKYFQVSLIFDDFDMHGSNGCNSDYVELRDGPFKYSPLIGTFCGLQLPKSIQTSDRFLYVKFRSDGRVHKRGFSARFMKVSDKCKNKSHGCS